MKKQRERFVKLHPHLYTNLSSSIAPLAIISNMLTTDTSENAYLVHWVDDCSGQTIMVSAAFPNISI